MANQKFCGAVASQAYRWGYICEYCKQPVEKKNVPAPQAANTAPARLAAPARLTIIRDSSVVGIALVMGVFLDNQPACTIKNGESATVTLTMKHSVLRVNATGSPNVRLDVTAPEGGVGEVHMKGGVFLPRTLKWNE